MSDQSSLLWLNDLHVTIPQRHGQVTPLNGVELRVHSGETVGVVGESGSGKTMTALAVMGLLPTPGRVCQGSVVFDGRDLTASPESDVRRIRGTQIGMIFQDPMTSLNPTMKIGDQIGEPLIVHKSFTRRDARQAAIDIMTRVGMPRPAQIVDDYPHQLSGGMRQRAMIAMALVCHPKLLIADEPTTALDVTTQRQILDLIDDLKAELGSAVILVTHDLGVVAGRAETVAVMYAGRVMEAGSARELFDSPQHQYTRALLAALPERAIQTRCRLYSIPGMPPDLHEAIIGCPFAYRCPRVDERCRTQTPIGQAGHYVACFHPGGEPLDGGRHPAAVGERKTSHEQPVVEIKHVDKNYDALGGKVFRHKIGSVSAVNDVSFVVRPGETFGLVGESGCGKSTLGRLIAGLEPPSSGSIAVKGEDVSQLTRAGKRRLHRNVQMMFQDSAAAMDPRMRIDEILLEPMEIQQMGTHRERESKAESLVDGVGLAEDALERYPHQFSGGQLQRVGLARAIALDPSVIVCDEPVSALDVSVQAQVLNLMRDLQQRHDLAYVFISHDLSVVRYMSDRIGVMYLGKLVEIGPADEVVDHPLHPYTRALLDSIPAIDPQSRGKDRLIIEGEIPSAIDPPQGCRFKTRCPFATQQCATTPLLAALSSTSDSSDAHLVACHFPLADPPTDHDGAMVP